MRRAILVLRVIPDGAHRLRASKVSTHSQQPATTSTARLEPADGYICARMQHAARSLNRSAFDATVHCLTGCAIGEVLGLVIGTALGLHDLVSILLAVVLAFVFGYSLTIGPLLATGMAFRSAVRTALAADTVSIVVMEIVDNLIVLAIPGAMAAGLFDPLFWGSLALSLLVAFVVAWPVNRWLIGRGLGHAVAHAGH
jgi:Domain of unknown function (DUF4396)